MNLQINRTAPGLKKYPLHRHHGYEIMHYLYGEGVLKTQGQDIPFAPGTVILVPPGIEHGSESEHGFENISIGGNFEHLLYFHQPEVLTDVAQEGALLAELLYENRYRKDEYISALCEAYIHLLLQSLKNEDKVHGSVQQIAREITKNALSPGINLTQILRQGGYAEDYIRSCFKRITGKTPHGFLTDIRIRHARFLIEIYGETLNMSEIAGQCGYTDYVYFSKKFKEETGMSPALYRKSI